MTPLAQPPCLMFWVMKRTHDLLQVVRARKICRRNLLQTPPKCGSYPPKYADLLLRQVSTCCSNNKVAFAIFVASVSHPLLRTTSRKCFVHSQGSSSRIVKVRAFHLLPSLIRLHSSRLLFSLATNKTDRLFQGNNAPPYRYDASL